MNDYNAIELLIVEDDPMDAELTIRTLKRSNLANNIYLAEDGAEALDFFFCRGKFENRSIEIAPKVVLLDLKLPKVSGLEVLKIVKEDKRTMHIPIVIVTSSREEPDMKEPYKLGVNSYVVKPLDFNQFADAIHNLGLYWLLVNQPVR
jgi:two-component system, response regulator